MEVGSLSVPVRADLGPITRDLERLKRQLAEISGAGGRGGQSPFGELEREVGRARQQTQSLTAALRPLATALAGVFGAQAIVRTLADFEASMSRVQAITRATAPDLEAMRDTIKDLGATTEFSTSQVADGFAFLGLAGFNATQSIAAMPAVLDLATAATLDLGRAADISSNIMSAFGIQAENAAQVADVLAATNARANTDVSQLGDAMKYAGPVARALGISINDTAAAIGTLSDAGIQGSMAGTSLRRILSSLANATPEATRTLRAMGLTLDELNPKTNDLTDIVERLRRAGITAAEAFTIFGDRGAPAILALTENNAKLNRLTEELKDVNGAALEMATIFRDNLQGDLRNLFSAIESVIIGLGEAGLTTALRTVVQGVTEVTRVIAEQTGRIVSYATAIAGAVAGWGAYVAIVAVATNGTALLSAALIFLRVNLIRIGIGALIVGLGELIYQFTRLAERAGGVGNAFSLLGEIASDVFQGIVTSAGAIPPGLQSVWTNVKADFILLIRDLGLEWNKFLAIFEQPALTVTAGGRTFEILGGLDLSEFKAETGEAITAAARLRGEAGKLRDEARSLAKDGFDQARDSLRGLNQLLSGESTGGRSRYRSGSTTDTNESLPPVTPRTPADPEAGRKAERLREAYQDLLRDGRAFIELQGIEAQAIGMTDLEAAKLRATFDLLNSAKRAGITLTAAQTEELTNLAHQMAESEYQTNKLREAYEFNKDTFKGFFTDLRQSLQNGASIWEAFGNAAANALQKIADKALDLALSGIFDIIFGAFGGGGNFFTRLLGFENGTSYAPGGLAVVGERGPELVKLPGGAQVTPNNRVTAPLQASFGGGYGGGVQQVAIDVFVKDDGKIGAIARQEAGSVVEVAIHEYDSNQLPSSVQRIAEHPRMR